MSGVKDFYIDQGTDWSVTLTWTANGTLVDLTAWTAHMQIRSGNADVIAATTYVDLSSTLGGISLGGTAGTIVLSIPAATTSALLFGNAVYDLKMIGPSGTTRLLKGTVYLSPEVTTAP